MKLKLKPDIKMAIIINIIAITILIAVVIIGRTQSAELSAVNDKLTSDNDKLIADIEAQDGIINALMQDNERLKNSIAQLNDSIAELQDVKNKLEDANSKLEDANNCLNELENANGKLKEDNDNLTKYIELLETKEQELLIKIEQLEEEISEIKENNNSASSHKDFKSYMSYKAITSVSSKQWKLQQQATTNEDGIRCIDGIPMVAVGTGWGLDVGDIALVTCENGNTFKVIIGDTKSDRHTDEERKTTVDNGCRCEFIVDVSKIDSTAKRLGNMAVLDKYRGYVVNIEKIG